MAALVRAPLGRRPRLVALALALLVWSSATAAPSGAATWSVQESPNPAGSIESSLRAVSCPTEAFCIAVGQGKRETLGAPIPLVERWSGGAWTIDAVPGETPSMTLLGVSCTSASACVAVGSDGSVALHWNGTRWTIQTLPRVAGALLLSVSCGSSSECVATGLAGEEAVAFHWNGSEWTLTSVPAPPAGEEEQETAAAQLSAVSCSAAGSCTAVGTYIVSIEGIPMGLLPLAVTWNGSRWTVQTAPASPDLIALSCASEALCMGARSWGGNTFVERWNGRAWSIERTLDPSPNTNIFNGVDCPTARACYAVGFAGNASRFFPLVEHWNGESWTVLEALTPRLWTIFTSISCSASAICTAVGHARESGGYETLVERYE